jgi:polysaccharide pyruvyl transferase CsaB
LSSLLRSISIDSAAKPIADNSGTRTERTIAVSGYYGCGNAGDEAVLAGIKEAFRRAGESGIRLVPLSQNPELTRALHGLDARYRMDMRTVRALLGESDLLLSGGGSLLQDSTSLRSLLYYLWVVRIALGLRVPVMFYAQGMAPFRRPLARWLVRLTANRVSYITVRDEPSAHLLASIGVSVPPIEVTADPAFALQPVPKEEVDAAWAAERLPTTGRPKIGVALRPWGPPGPAQVDEYAALLIALERRTGGEVILIPMQLPGDAVFSDALCSKAGRSFPMARNVASPSTLLGIVGAMDAVVAMRLHTLIFAARMAVPPFALAYDPKVENLMRGLDLPDSLAPWTGFSPDDVAGRVKQLLDERVERSSKLAARAGELEKLALRNAEIALTLMN